MREAQVSCRTCCCNSSPQQGIYASPKQNCTAAVGCLRPVMITGGEAGMGPTTRFRRGRVALPNAFPILLWRLGAALPTGIESSLSSALFFPPNSVSLPQRKPWPEFGLLPELNLRAYEPFQRPSRSIGRETAGRALMPNPRHRRQCPLFPCASLMCAQSAYCQACAESWFMRMALCNPVAG